MLSGEGNENGEKTDIGLITKKELCTCSVLCLYISLPLFWMTATWNLRKLPSYTFYGGNVWRVLVHFFSLSLIFTLVAASIPSLQNFMFFLQQKISPFVFFSLALAPFLVELCWPVDLLSLFLCLSLSLYPKFVDMTINLSLILLTIQIQKHFPLSVFVFIDSLVVFASQDAGGHTLSRQNNLTFGIGLHVVGARTVVRP